ncbi:uncharacterized protein LOC126176525 [Schistocerca cancellata]|uniref:uncharacterized protein LOC126176525 n=1 Tax=Schistocerca cancellata TaxID=274614 RepID=UPI002118555F|nr:uncharacterized protein LOC126176525 [Schistocerca cancellata]
MMNLNAEFPALSLRDKDTPPQDEQHDENAMEIQQTEQANLAAAEAPAPAAAAAAPAPTPAEDITTPAAEAASADKMPLSEDSAEESESQQRPARTQPKHARTAATQGKKKCESETESTGKMTRDDTSVQLQCETVDTPTYAGALVAAPTVAAPAQQQVSAVAEAVATVSENVPPPKLCVPPVVAELSLLAESTSREVGNADLQSATVQNVHSDGTSEMLVKSPRPISVSIPWTDKRKVPSRQGTPTAGGVTKDHRETRIQEQAAHLRQFLDTQGDKGEMPVKRKSEQAGEQTLWRQRTRAGSGATSSTRAEPMEAGRECDCCWTGQDVVYSAASPVTSAGILSTDFANAFDRVSHDYLLQVMSHMSFGLHFLEGGPPPPSSRDYLEDQAEFQVALRDAASTTASRRSTSRGSPRDMPQTTAADLTPAAAPATARTTDAASTPEDPEPQQQMDFEEESRKRKRKKDDSPTACTSTAPTTRDKRAKATTDEEGFTRATHTVPARQLRTAAAPATPTNNAFQVLQTSDRETQPHPPPPARQTSKPPPIIVHCEEMYDILQEAVSAVATAPFQFKSAGIDTYRLHTRTLEDYEKATRELEKRNWGYYTYSTTKCAKCAGNHPAEECKKDANTPPTCARCSQQHPANYMGCEVVKAHIAGLRRPTSDRRSGTSYAAATSKAAGRINRPHRPAPPVPTAQPPRPTTAPRTPPEDDQPVTMGMLKEAVAAAVASAMETMLKNIPQQINTAVLAAIGAMSNIPGGEAPVPGAAISLKLTYAAAKYGHNSAELPTAEHEERVDAPAAAATNTELTDCVVCQAAARRA